MAAPKKPEHPQATIDTSTIRYLLTLTPEERVRLAGEEARNLRRFDLEVAAGSKGKPGV